MAQKFLKLIDKHFPKSSRLHKIFNRNAVKVSYSCVPNVKSDISSHNHRVLKKINVVPSGISCNCRNKTQYPLEGKCLTTSVVYKAAITNKDTQQTMNYIGVTAGPFKDGYNNHRKSLNNYAYRKETEKNGAKNTPSVNNTIRFLTVLIYNAYYSTVITRNN